MQVGHLDGGHGGVEALVAALGAGAVDGLFQRVGGEHAEGDRHAGFHRDVGHALGGLGGHVIEMRRFAADHGAQADDGVVAVLAGQFAGHQRHFPGAGNLDDVHSVRDRRRCA